MAVKNHKLKILPKYFKAVQSNKKLFELRKDDRDYRVDDYLVLAEWDAKTESWTGNVVKRKIAYILKGGEFGLEEGYAILGFDIKHIIKLDNPAAGTLEERRAAFGLELKPFVDSGEYTREMVAAFFSYWTEKSHNGKKMRYEKMPTFEISRRLITWAKNDKKYNPEEDGGEPELGEFVK